MTVKEYSIYKKDSDYISTIFSVDDGIMILKSDGNFNTIKENTFFSEWSLVSSHTGILGCVNELQRLNE